MKKYESTLGFDLGAMGLMIILAICAWFLTTIQKLEGQTVFEPKTPIPLGERAVPYVLAQVKSVEVSAKDESERSEWSLGADVDGFTSIAQFKACIRQFHPALNGIDPRDRISIQGRCLSENGTELLEAWTSTYLEKFYEETTHQPFWAVTETPNLGFYVTNIPLVFTSQLVDAQANCNGNDSWEGIPFDGNTLVVPGWLAWQTHVTLRLSFANGEVVDYDGHTGQPVNSHSINFAFDGASVDGIVTRQMPESRLSYTVAPEWGSNPVMEITPMITGMGTFQVQSEWGRAPLAIWVSTMSDLKTGWNWRYVPVDSNGTFQYRVTNSQPILIWAEFQPWVENDGGKG